MGWYYAAYAPEGKVARGNSAQVRAGLFIWRWRAEEAGQGRKGLFAGKSLLAHSTFPSQRTRI
jgi:hypothetical protein